jgi:hypothetical protein
MELGGSKYDDWEHDCIVEIYWLVVRLIISYHTFWLFLFHPFSICDLSSSYIGGVLHRSLVQTARTFLPPSPTTLLEKSRVTVGIEVAMIYKWPMKSSGDRLSQSEDCCGVSLCP